MTTTLDAVSRPAGLLDDDAHLLGGEWSPARGAIGAPFGGYRHSGFGRTMSAGSILEYTQVKSVIINGVS